MGQALDGHGAIEESTEPQPRFGSYIGLFYVTVIIGILGFAVVHDTGIKHAFDELRPGMTTTEVAARLGVPRSETKSGARVVQTWQIPDGHTIVVEFENGKLMTKDRKPRADGKP